MPTPDQAQSIFCRGRSNQLCSDPRCNQVAFCVASAFREAKNYMSGPDTLRDIADSAAITAEDEGLDPKKYFQMIKEEINRLKSLK